MGVKGEAIYFHGYITYTEKDFFDIISLIFHTDSYVFLFLVFLLSLSFPLPFSWAFVAFSH